MAGPSRRKSSSAKAAKTPARSEARAADRTLSGLPVDLVVGPTAGEVRRSLDALGFPGDPPFTRGIRPTMYRGRLWTMRQFAGFGPAAATNERFRYLLEHGQTGLSTAFAMPTLMGYDSDHPLSEGEVGKCGVAVSSLADMETLLEGLPLEQALIEAGAIRLRPIVLTAAAAILGSAVIVRDPVWSGLALALIFGMLASTALTLVVIPVFYYIVEKKHWEQA